MKKALFITALFTALILALAPAAIGYYIGDNNSYGYTYDTGNSNYQYVYDYSNSMYGPNPYYTTTQPVYRITGTMTPDTTYAYNYNTPYLSQTSNVVANPYFSSQKFVDVSPSDQNFTAIQWLGLNNIAGGFDAGRYFQPNRNITRAEFVVMVVNGARQSPSATTYRNCFNDVSDDWYASKVCFARANGWLPSSLTTDFRSTSSITTSEANDILNRAYGVSANMPSTTYLTRSQTAAILYSILASGRVSVRLNANGYNYNNNYNNYNNTAYVTPYVDSYYGTNYVAPYSNSYVAPYVAPVTTTNSSYYNYNPYDNNYSSPTYCQYINGQTYYSATYMNGYYPCNNSYYNNNYARQTYYNDPWHVGVPAGYYGPWNG